MALTTVTLQPSSTAQLGTWTISGAATANVALSDGSDASYVQQTARSRLDSEILRVGFPVPSLPAGAKVLSVGLRRRIQTVTTTTSQPVCHHWFRCLTGGIAVSGQTTTPQKTFFNSLCPQTTVSAWVTESVATFTSAPDGSGWDTATNLATFTYDMGRGDDFGGTLRISEVYLDVTYQQASTISVTGPTGTINTTRPTVTWLYSSPDSQPQQAYQVAIYTSAQVSDPGFVPFVTVPLQQSGWLQGEDLQWTLNADLADGSYSVYVQAQARWAGVGDFITRTASATFTRAATPASPPPAAILQSATFDATNNRVAIVMAPSGTTPATVAFTVEASRDGGVTYTPIPSLTYLPANGMSAITRYDYVAPIGVTSKYRVLAYSSPANQLVAATTYSSIGSVTTSGDAHWLKHPSNPLLNTILPVAAPKSSNDGIKITKRRLMGTFQRIGSAGAQVLPIVVQGPTYGDEYAIELFFDGSQSTDYWTAVDQLDQSGSVLLFQRPSGEQVWVAMGPGASGQETEETYNALPGRPGRVLWRRRKVVLTQVDPPVYY